jgi:hypothetical protein
VIVLAAPIVSERSKLLILGSMQASSRIHHVFESLSRAAAVTSSSVMALSFFL